MQTIPCRWYGQPVRLSIIFQSGSQRAIESCKFTWTFELISGFEAQPPKWSGSDSSHGFDFSDRARRHDNRCACLRRPPPSQKDRKHRKLAGRVRVLAGAAAQAFGTDGIRRPWQVS